MLLCRIIHGFKSSVTRQINQRQPNNNFKWQRSFYDQIIYNEDVYHKIRQYILNTPSKWQTDKNNPNLNMQIPK